MAVIKTLARKLRRQWIAPAGVSKTMAKALGCGYYFIHQALGGSDIKSVAGTNSLARTGREFHAYRAAYIDHLVETMRWQDPEWIEGYIAHAEPSDDATWLIRKDAETFRIDPDSVIGAEVFLSCDANLNPLDYEVGNATPGKLSVNPAAFASATIDLLCIVNGKAIIIDPKSGFSTVGVTDDEPPINALVTFAHFSNVHTVEFRWDFIRARANRRAIYTREDIPWMMDRVHALNRRKHELVNIANAGEALPVEPFAGLCHFCLLDCPLRRQVEDGTLVIAPPQTHADRRRIAGLIMALETMLPKLRDLMRPVLDDEESLRLNDEWVYKAEISVSNSYPLIGALNALGLAVVDLSRKDEWERQLLLEEQPKVAARYDVPLESLTAGARKLNDLAKTKKSKRRKDATGNMIGGVSREGLGEALEAIAQQYPKTLLRFRKESQTDLIDALQQSIEAATHNEE